MRQSPARTRYTATLRLARDGGVTIPVDLAAFCYERHCSQTDCIGARCKTDNPLDYEATNSIVLIPLEVS